MAATAHVLVLWPLEIVSVTLRGPRKPLARPSEEDIATFFEILRRMPLRILSQGMNVFVDQAVPRMRKHKLTSYDTAYPLLAKTMGLPLATRDGSLAKAAQAEGVGLTE